MVSPISPAARAYVRSRATDVMSYVCRIERVQPPSYDEETLIGSPGSRETVYEGVCRIWEVTGGASVSVSDVDVSVATTQLSIPWDVEVVPRKDDEVLITESELDPLLIGARFLITDVAKAGELRATRRFSVLRTEYGHR